MKYHRTFLTVMTLLLTFSAAQSQVLISLLLGDKLNSGKIEFGLEGGASFLNMTGLPHSNSLNTWNLGFYFDFVTKNPKLFIHSGVLVKTKMGASGIAPYSVNNPAVDDLFSEGSVTRSINYFNVPFLLRYRFYSYFFVEGGIQLGLRYTAYDTLTQAVYESDDLQFKYAVKDNFARLDAGGEGGVGYKLRKGTGMTISAKYYYGFVDVDKVTPGSQKNTAIYLNLSIPIGKAKAAEKRKNQAAK
jgi:hypothetical protein